MKLHRIAFPALLCLALLPTAAHADSQLVFQLKWGNNGTGNGQFNGPTGMAASPVGDVFVTDRFNHRVQKFTSTGAFLLAWGDSGSLNGEFDTPLSVAISPTNGQVYVSDSKNHRIQRFTTSGGFQGTWGSFGTGSGQFDNPRGVTVDASGNVYVADWGNERIQKFNSTGTFLLAWGTSGTAPGQFQSPFGLTTDALGNVFVADSDNHRIQKFNSSGAFLSAFGDSGSGNGQFVSPYGIDMDPLGYIYVSDAGFHRIQKFTSAGVYVDKVGQFGSSDGRFDTPEGLSVNDSCQVFVSDFQNDRVQRFGVPLPTTAPPFMFKWGTYGTENGQFNNPYVIDANQWFFYVGDTFNHRVQKFDSHARYLLKWGSFGTGNGQFRQVTGIAVDSNGNVFATDNSNHRVQKFSPGGTFLLAFGDSGTGNGQFRFPRGLTVDSGNNVYVAGNLLDNVQKFDNNGVYLLKWGSSGTANGKFAFPRGLAAGPGDVIYVADHDNDRIQKFSSTGSFLLKWGDNGVLNGQFDGPQDVAVDGSGNVYVTDELNFRVQKFNSSGGFLTKWGTGPGGGDGEFTHAFGITRDPCDRIVAVEWGYPYSRAQVFGVDTGCGPNTPVGTGVPVELPSGVTATFDSIVVEGFTTVTTTATGPNLFPGISFVPASPRRYYDIASTATRLGEIQVCINYNQGEVLGSENDLMLYHYDTSISPASWREITSSINTGTNQICGYVSSLSLFTIAEPGSPTAVGDKGVPREFRFFPSAPTPFRGATAVQFDLPRRGRVSLEVFDLQGRLVRSLLNEELDPGRYSEVWEGRNQASQPVSPGIYFYRLRTEDQVATQKVIKVS